jgi:hypothetical protein
MNEMDSSIAAPVTFHSKVDGWIVVTFFVAGVLQVFILGLLAVRVPFALLVVLPLLALGVWTIYRLYRGTRYVITHDQLQVRAALLRIDIPLAEIAAIEPTRNPLSAPAWSLDRLLIRYGQGRFCLISPQAKEQFLALLRERGVHGA